MNDGSVINSDGNKSTAIDGLLDTVAQEIEITTNENDNLTISDNVISECEDNGTPRLPPKKGSGSKCRYEK